MKTLFFWSCVAFFFYSVPQVFASTTGSCKVIKFEKEQEKEKGKTCVITKKRHLYSLFLILSSKKRVTVEVELSGQTIQCGALKLNAFHNIKERLNDACEMGQFDTPRMFSDELSFELLGQWNHYVSIKKENDGYFGGARPFNSYQYGTFDTKTGKQVSVGDIFPNSNQILRQARALHKKELEKEWGAHFKEHGIVKDSSKDEYNPFDTDAFSLSSNGNGVLITFYSPGGLVVNRNHILEVSFPIPKQCLPFSSKKSGKKVASLLGKSTREKLQSLLSPDYRLIEKQSFVANLTPVGRVYFVTAQKSKQASSTQFRFNLVQNGKILHSFSPLVSSKCTYSTVLAVAFRNLDDDKHKDIVVMLHCVQNLGDKKQPNSHAFAYFYRKHRYVLLPSVQKVLQQHNFINVMTVVDFIKRMNVTVAESTKK